MRSQKIYGRSSLTLYKFTRFERGGPCIYDVIKYNNIFAGNRTLDSRNVDGSWVAVARFSK